MENPGSYNSSDAYYPYDYYYYNYDYNYTYEESLNYLPLDELIPSLTFYVLIGLLGLAGNILVIVAILAFPRMKSITNVFLLSLASADLLLVLICVPIKLTAFFSYTWRVGPFLCTFVAYIQNVSMVCSVLTLTVMSIERFVAIIYPLQARSFCTMKHAKFVTIFIWIGSFVIASPTAFVQKLKEVGNSQRKAHWCVKQYMSHEFEIAYEVYMFFILFAIPLGVMLVTYIRISIEIWDVVSKRAVLRSGSEYNYSSSQSQSNGAMARESSFVTQSSTKSKSVPNACSEDAKTRKQVILMLMVIVLLFAICWGPILLNNLLVAAKVISDLHEGFLKPMRMAFHLMSYANSCVNPIVYGIMSKNFQDSLKSVLKCCNSRQTYRTYVYSTDTTRASILKSSNSEDKDNGCIEMN